MMTAGSNRPIAQSRSCTVCHPQQVHQLAGSHCCFCHTNCVVSDSLVLLLLLLVCHCVYLQRTHAEHTGSRCWHQCCRPHTIGHLPGHTVCCSSDGHCAQQVPPIHPASSGINAHKHGSNGEPPPGWSASTGLHLMLQRQTTFACSCQRCCASVRWKAYFKMRPGVPWLQHLQQHTCGLHTVTLSAADAVMHFSYPFEARQNAIAISP